MVHGTRRLRLAITCPTDDPRRGRGGNATKLFRPAHCNATKLFRPAHTGAAQAKARRVAELSARLEGKGVFAEQAQEQLESFTGQLGAFEEAALEHFGVRGRAPKSLSRGLDRPRTGRGDAAAAT